MLITASNLLHFARISTTKAFCGVIRMTRVLALQVSYKAFFDFANRMSVVNPGVSPNDLCFIQNSECAFFILKSEFRVSVRIRRTNYSMFFSS